MAGISTSIERAAATHRRAAAITHAAGAALDRHHAAARPATGERSIRELAERLRAAAALLTPGWLGASLDAVPASTPLGACTAPELVRLGVAYPLDDASFPVVVPLGHVAFDADARDSRVAGVLRAVLLRLLATARPGSLLVRPVDPAGTIAGPFAALHDAGIMPPPVTDRIGLAAVLTEAEHWVRGGAHPDRTLLLVVGSWPADAAAPERTRLAALAAAGPAARLHLLVAGWPPPPTGEDTPVDAGAPAAGPEGPSTSPLPHATQVRVHNPYVLVGHPPDGSFAAAAPAGAGPLPGLHAPVYLDPAPPAELVTRVSGELATRAVDRARMGLGELLPDGPVWRQDAAPGLTVPVGRAGDTPVSLRLSGATGHWLVAGRPRSGRSALLLNILYGLCSQYGPDQLGVYLLDFTGHGTFAEFVPQPQDPSCLPHARAIGIEPSRADGAAVLRGLARQLTRRLTTGAQLPRVVCLVDGVDALLDGDDELATEAMALLRSLTGRGGGCGIHLVLAGRTVPPPEVANHCRVRIALPGGSAALDAANDAAVTLALGHAVVNTASGLGGPRGATRAHEQLVRFPDPYPDRAALAGLRHSLWRAGRHSTDSGG